MAATNYKPEWQRAVIALSAAVIAALIVGVLYWARVVLIPFALAVFLTFVLAPVVRAVERCRVPRAAAAFGVVGLALVAAGLTGWVVGLQVADLADTLPRYEENIKGKIEAVRGWVGGPGTGRLMQMVERLSEVATPEPASPLAGTPPTVVVASPSPAWLAPVQAAVGPAAEVLGQVAFTFILVVFMLIRKEDLRNRLLRLIGHGRVTRATKALDDASQRVSRFLLMQLLINVGFGLVATAGLVALGVPNAPLWGFVGTVMRYVPFIGTWIGLVPPLVFSFAVSDGLAQPAGVVALFLGLEALCNNLFEPWLFGTSLGVSEVAQLMATGFWLFLWGPVGVVLSGPLTTCLLVVGKHVPQLRFLEVLLGDEPPLEPSVAVFQRLMARDRDEASRIAHAHTPAGGDPAAAFDAVLAPALRLTKAGVADGDLSADDERFILRAAREIADELADPPHPADGRGDRVRVLACPADDDADRLALDVFARLLPADRWDVRVTGADALTSELVAAVGTDAPAVVAVGSLPPGGVAHTRYLCKRLKARFPGLTVVVVRWAGPDDDAADAAAVGADAVATSFADARRQFAALHPVLEARQDGLPGGPRNGKPAAAAGTASA